MGLVSDKAGHVADVDKHTKGLTTIDAVHKMVHAGRLFTGTLKANIANNAYMDIVLNPSAAAHSRLIVFSAGFCELTAYADGPFVKPSPATEMLLTNRNGYSPRTASIDVYQSPVLGSPEVLGTQIFGPMPVFAGEKGKAFGQGEEVYEEMILNHNTEYLIRIQNLSGQVRDIYAVLAVYHPDE